MHSRHKKWMAMSILVCFLCCILPVKAAGQINPETPVSITIQYTASEAEFALYKVADVSEEVYFTPTAEFEIYPVEMNGLDADGWRILAETLYVYVNKDSISSTVKCVTDADGNAVFEDLSTGLYLVVGEPTEGVASEFVPTPFLVSLPSEMDDGQWDYELEVAAKMKPQDDQRPKQIKRRVIKIWKDEGNEEKRPSKIEVELFKDGEVYETVALNKENNWSYVWEELSSDYEWFVVEKEVPEDYKMTVSQENETFEITNTTTEKPPEDIDRIPQTGQLWWPVPILAVAGILMFLIGFVRRNFRGESDA